MNTTGVLSNLRWSEKLPKEFRPIIKRANLNILKNVNCTDKEVSDRIRIYHEDDIDYLVKNLEGEEVLKEKLLKNLYYSKT